MSQQEQIEAILNNVGERHIMVEHRLIHQGMPEQNGKNIETQKGVVAITALIQEAVNKVLGADESGRFDGLTAHQKQILINYHTKSLNQLSGHQEQTNRKGIE